jgi:hypothetical protein
VDEFRGELDNLVADALTQLQHTANTDE